MRQDDTILHKFGPTIIFEVILIKFLQLQVKMLSIVEVTWFTIMVAWPKKELYNIRHAVCHSKFITGLKILIVKWRPTWKTIVLIGAQRGAQYSLSKILTPGSPGIIQWRITFNMENWSSKHGFNRIRKVTSIITSKCYAIEITVMAVWCKPNKRNTNVIFVIWDR